MTSRPNASRVRVPRVTVVMIGLAVSAVTLAACGSSPSPTHRGVVSVVAAENEYGNVASQVGGRYVAVTSVESNPNVDPHNYEASPQVAGDVSAAGLVIQNGVGYDSWITTLESASPNAGRHVIVAQSLLGFPNSTANPHLWYDPKTMPLVANAVATALSDLQPTHAAYFHANARAFIASLHPWLAAIAEFKATYAGTKAATTEPVADYLLTAMGIDNVTPFIFQADIMNGTEPTPQNVALENRLFSHHTVKVFAYNQQVVDSLTESIRSNAQSAGVPVVGVYETMPTGYDYQNWMLAETTDIRDAVVNGTSTVRL